MSAMRVDDATKKYVLEALQRLHDVDPEHLAKNVLALTQAMGINVEKAQLLRDRPTEIKEVRSADENIRILQRLGMLKKADVVDAEVVEESDV
jgi:hypothetical protein